MTQPAQSIEVHDLVAQVPELQVKTVRIAQLANLSDDLPKVLAVRLDSIISAMISDAMLVIQAQRAQGGTSDAAPANPAT